MENSKETTQSIREILVEYIGKAAAYREELIPKDKPWDAKNQKHAACLNAVKDYIETLPDDNPQLQKLADNEHLYDEDAGFSVPDDEWNDVIHCRSDNAAAWFQDWAQSLIEWERPEPEESDDSDDWENWQEVTE